MAIALEAAVPSETVNKDVNTRESSVGMNILRNDGPILADVKSMLSLFKSFIIKTISEMFKSHRSMPRNKLIANAFFFAGFVEAWGRGFEIIEKAFKEADLEIPKFNEEFNGVAANIKREVFYAIQYGARIDERTGKLIKPVDDTKNDTKKITDRQRLILDLLSIGISENDTKNNTKTTSAIAIKLGMSIATIKRDLKYLQDIGFIEHCGPSRGGHWKVLVINRRSE